MKKRSMKWKKSGSTGNEERGLNTWYIGKAMEINITNG